MIHQSRLQLEQRQYVQTPTTYLTVYERGISGQNGASRGRCELLRFAPGDIEIGLCHNLTGVA